MTRNVVTFTFTGLPANSDVTLEVVRSRYSAGASDVSRRSEGQRWLLWPYAAGVVALNGEHCPRQL